MRKDIFLAAVALAATVICLTGFNYFHCGVHEEETVPVRTITTKDGPKEGAITSEIRMYGVKHTPPAFLNIQRCSHSYCNHTTAILNITLCEKALASPKICPEHLKIAMLQAKQFNPVVYLYEAGGSCKAFASKHFVEYVDLGFQKIGNLYCRMMPNAKPGSYVKRSGWLWQSAMMRWLIVGDPDIEWPARFNLLDHDMMAWTDSTRYFDRFGDDAEIAICCYHPVCNGIYSLFTHRSAADLTRYVLEGLQYWYSDIHALISYTYEGTKPEEFECWANEHTRPLGLQSNGLCAKDWIRAPPEASLNTSFPVHNSCLEMPDGRVSEYIMGDREGIYELWNMSKPAKDYQMDTFRMGSEMLPGHKLYYRKGHLHYKLLVGKGDKRKWKKVSKSPFQRIFGAHFAADCKKLMKCHFRPDSMSINETGCKECLQEDCDCMNTKCESCFTKCSDKCQVLRDFVEAIEEQQRH